MQYSKDTVQQALKLVAAMRDKVPALSYDKFNWTTDSDEFKYLVRIAKEYNSIQEKACNGELTARQTSREGNIEKEVTRIAHKYGMAVQFSGDPRGYCVKLHAPTKDVYNTWGGAETGYGIG